MPSVRLTFATAASLLAAACGDGQPPEQAGVVDSTLPIPVLLDRFRAGLDRPVELSGGAGSLDELVARFARAVEAADSAAFRDLALTRAEFAWLYYPALPEAAPPYELDPGLMWFMIEGNSGRGLYALLEAVGGRPLGMVSYSCESERHHGPLTLWGPCLVRRVQNGADTVTESLFGPVVSRDGRFKFVSYANRL
jgi:hypothetical protein